MQGLYYNLGSYFCAAPSEIANAMRGLYLLQNALNDYLLSVYMRTSSLYVEKVSLNYQIIEEKKVQRLGCRGSAGCR